MLARPRKIRTEVCDGSCRRSPPWQLRNMYLQMQSVQHVTTGQTNCPRDRAGRGKQEGCRTRIGGSSGSSPPSYGPVAAELHPYSRVPKPVHQNLLLFLFMLLAMIGGAELDVCELPIDSDDVSAELAAHDGQIPIQSSADLKHFAKPA